MARCWYKKAAISCRYPLYFFYKIGYCYYKIKKKNKTMSYPRPLSPHLQIYKPQLTSVLSISHRLTGIALAIGAIPLVYWLWSVSQGPEHYEFVFNVYGSPLGLILLFGWSYCFFFHLANGIRHLFWDAGYGFELAQVYFSGWLVVAASVGLTLLSWAIGFMCTGECSYDINY
jgi:succinate dehydrogenase / fumarate reductase, cytochrome b subunit